jgi:hypothetical protein
VGEGIVYDFLGVCVVIVCVCAWCEGEEVVVVEEGGACGCFRSGWVGGAWCCCEKEDVGEVGDVSFVVSWLNRERETDSVRE